MSFFCKYIYYFLFFLAYKSQAQHLILLQRSDYKHDYVVGKSYYIENLKDTTRYKYIATLNYNCLNHSGLILESNIAIKNKCKELGANLYFVSNVYYIDSLISFDVKTYFGSINAIDVNNEKHLQNNMIFFSLVNHGDTYQNFYINDSLKSFKSNSIFELRGIKGNQYEIKACYEIGVSFMPNFLLGGLLLTATSLKFPVHYNLKKNKNAIFVGVFNEKTTLVPFTLSKNAINCGVQKFDYDYGRLIYAVMKFGNSK